MCFVRLPPRNTPCWSLFDSRLLRDVECVLSFAYSHPRYGLVVSCFRCDDEATITSHDALTGCDMRMSIPLPPGACPCCVLVNPVAYLPSSCCHLIYHVVPSSRHLLLIALAIVCRDAVPLLMAHMRYFLFISFMWLCVRAPRRCDVFCTDKRKLRKIVASCGGCMQQLIAYASLLHVY